VRLLAIVLLPSLLAAQETPVFRSEASLALVRFHVVRKQTYVVDLKPEDIVLVEDGLPRRFTLFEGGQSARRTVPVDFTLLFDTSGSVRGRELLTPLVFKESLLDGLERVRIAVYGFGKQVDRYTRPTRDFAQLQAAFSAIRKRGLPAETIALHLPPGRKSDPYGATWLFESIAATAADAEGGATRMLLVFSDGFGTTSAEPQDAAGICQELGVPVYPVVLGHADLVAEARMMPLTGKSPQATAYALKQIQQKEETIEKFASLGELTGGRSFDPPEITLAVMRQVLAGMVAQVQTEYVVGFVPERGGAGRQHKLEIRLRSKDLGRVLGGTRTLVH